MNVGELREALKDVPGHFILYLNDSYRTTPITEIDIDPKYGGSVELR